MYGQFIIEDIFFSNFFIFFSNFKYFLLNNLNQWQYWWWFWFIYYLILFFFLNKKTIFYRFLKFFPKINTSFRTHGKWGDIIICFIPISWCLNILTNSNFLLKLVEWQNKFDNFFLRVRGKQWYWVYKIDINNFIKILNFNKNIGFNSYFNNNISNKYININNLKIKNKIFFNRNICKGYSKYSFTKVNMRKFILTNNLFILNKSIINYNIYNLQTTNLTYFFKNYNTSVNSSYNSFLNIKKNINKDCGLFFLDFFKNNVKFKNYTDNLYITIKQKRNDTFNNFKKIIFFKKNIFLKDIFFKNYRLIKTQKLLILPININISIITNSFDVIHSWFIPGLGLKMDCVPGRSTHHSLFVENIGFYYGQCAEICGRFHHHMPIKLCFLSFNHFLIWFDLYFFKNI